MQHYQQDLLSAATGLPVVGAQVTIHLAGTATLALLYQANDVFGATYANPSIWDRLFAAYIPDGRYDVTVLEGGRSTTLYDVQIIDLVNAADALEQLTPELVARINFLFNRGSVQKRGPYPSDDSTKLYNVGDLWGMGNGQILMCSSTTALNATWAFTDLANLPLNNDTLPLDRVTGAAAAYGVWKLRAAYAGSCFQIQRASDNTTLDIGFVWDASRRVYVADWSAVDAFILAGAGGQAWYSKWYDQSGNALDALEDAAFKVYINSPTSNTLNDINGLRVWSLWGGTRNQMVLPAGLALARTNCTVVTGALLAATGHANSYGELGTDASYLNRLLLTTEARSGRLQVIGNTNYYPLRVESTPHVLGVSSGGAAMNYICNDVVGTSLALTASAMTGGYIGTANGGGYSLWGDLSCWIAYPTARTVAEMQTLRQSISRTMRLKPQPRDHLIPIGDSITVGADGAVQPWWRQIFDKLDRDFKVYNTALEGDTAVAAIFGIALQVTPYVQAGVTNIVTYAYGTNDLAALSAANGDAVNAVTVQGRIQAHCLAIRAANPTVKIVLATILPRNNSFTGGQTDASFEVSRLLVNTWLRTNYAIFADALADYGGDPYVGQHANVTDPTWMNGNLHPKARGQAYMGAYMLTAINGLA